MKDKNTNPARMNMVQEKLVPRVLAEQGIREFWLHPDYKWEIFLDSENMPIIRATPCPIIKHLQSKNKYYQYKTLKS